MSAKPDELAAVPEQLHWYFRHPGAWENIKTAILTHDSSCASLPHIWTGRTGGVSCPGEQRDCDDCGVCFYNEGLLGQYGPGWRLGDPILTTTDDGDATEAVLCDCCGTRRRSSQDR